MLRRPAAYVFFLCTQISFFAQPLVRWNHFSGCPSRLDASTPRWLPPTRLPIKTSLVVGSTVGTSCYFLWLLFPGTFINLWYKYTPCFFYFFIFFLIFLATMPWSMKTITFNSAEFYYFLSAFILKPAYITCFSFPYNSFLTKEYGWA